MNFLGTFEKDVELFMIKLSTFKLLFIFGRKPRNHQFGFIYLLLATRVLDVEQDCRFFIMRPKNSKGWANIYQLFHVSFDLNFIKYTLKRIGDDYALELIFTFLILTIPQLLVSNSMHFEETINDDIYSNNYKKIIILYQIDFSASFSCCFLYFYTRHLIYI